MNPQLTIRDLRIDESEALGRLMVAAYSRLEGYPKPAEAPDYYELLAGIGRLAQKPTTRVLVALTAQDKLVGGVVYLGDLADYSTHTDVSSIMNASGIRLLGVDPSSQRMGAGRALMTVCIELAKAHGHSQVILHSSQPMRNAWKLYDQLGFVKSTELDYMWNDLHVSGFRLYLRQSPSASTDIHGASPSKRKTMGLVN